ncbi:MAG: chromate resistance protein [Gammaproteobacteria bacterium]|nr:chromate resistance protein [Gammaproteobacteria bacterium]MBU1731834.1 chromate resistance protein [Gammaproteobacteria bacterium]MBU1892445.1 chromate resistance protein [Gammaproteobacteria bacterium]
MRIWRATRALGCAVLRDGVYLLPAGRGLRQALRMHAEEIKQGGGNAYLLNVANPSVEEKTDFQGLFDRSDEYQKLMERINEFIATLGALDATAGRRQLKVLSRDFEALVTLDYFSSSGKVEADAMLAQAEAAFFASLAADEPQAGGGEVRQREAPEYQQRLWATRKHLWVDRMASAWLIRRFIDRDARFLWLEKPDDCPPEALGFDFDGAEFTHIGNLVSFEVLLASFGLEGDPALAKLGALVHNLDVGGMPVMEASGVEMILGGIRKRCADDDALLADASKIFDDLYAVYGEEGK